MKFKKNNLGLLLRVLLLAATLLAFAFTILQKQFIYDALLVPVIIFQIVDFYRLHKKAQDEVEQFVESIHYRDFSKYFNVKEAPVEVQTLRQGFNEINSTFRGVSKEKEMQYQYLQKVLELVDTGILSYETQSGEIKWMNEALKKILA